MKTPDARIARSQAIIPHPSGIRAYNAASDLKSTTLTTRKRKPTGWFGDKFITIDQVIQRFSKWRPLEIYTSINAMII